MDNLYRLGNGTIDIWNWSLDRPVAEISRLWELLSEEETIRATRFAKERDAMRFTAGRGVLRQILGRYLGMSPRDIMLRTNAYGKPQIGVSTRPALHFNLSHSGSKAVLAVSDSYQLGIDIEEIKPISEDIAGHFFSPRECSQLGERNNDRYMAAFYRCWTRKEAFLKAYGTGLMLPLSSFDVTVAEGRAPKLERMEADAEATRKWTLHDIATPPGFAGALAARTNGNCVQLHYKSIRQIELSVA